MIIMKKAISILIIGIVTIIVIGIAYLGWIVYDTARPHITEISLTNINEEEKSKLIELNFLELDKYPQSLEFNKLKEISEVRETQFYIEFSINKYEKNLYDIEKNKSHSPNTISIEQKEENDEKVIYEMQTNFAQNSKAKKWGYLYELIERYK